MLRPTILGIAALLVSCGNGKPEVGQRPDPRQAKSQETNQARTVEHAVIVHFEYGNSDWAPFFEFEESLDAAIAAAGVGDYDGNELAVDGSDGTLFMYGPDADKLFELVKPRLESTKLLKNIEVTLRYGDADDPSARESKVRLGS